MKPARQPQHRGETLLSVSERVEQTWSGPLPPPGALEAYERTYSGAAKTIVDMAVSPQKHRQSLEAMDLSHRMFMEKCGLFTGFILGFVGVIGGCVLAYFGRDLTGFGVFFASLGSLVLAAIYKRHKTKG